MGVGEAYLGAKQLLTSRGTPLPPPLFQATSLTPILTPPRLPPQNPLHPFVRHGRATARQI